jgi:hypothetical protein
MITQMLFVRGTRFDRPGIHLFRPPPTLHVKGRSKSGGVFLKLLNEFSSATRYQK